MNLGCIGKIQVYVSRERRHVVKGAAYRILQQRRDGLCSALVLCLPSALAEPGAAEMRFLSRCSKQPRERASEVLRIS